MNIFRLGRNFTIIAFLLSLLFHITTIFYIFIQKTKNDLISASIEKNQEKSQKPYQHPCWVETKARPGNFGAPVFFDDEYEEQNEPLEEKKQTNDNNFLQEIKEKESQENIQNLPTPPSHENKEIATNTSIIDPSPPLSQQKIYVSPKKEKKIISPPKQYDKNYSPSTPSIKPSLTLAQLTQGFLHQRKQDSGTHSISMIGKQGLATDEQLKYERYLQKISWCIQNSFEINRSRFPSLSQTVTFKIFFAIARNGSVSQLALHQSSGNIHIDQCVLFVLREASTSFPPMPSYLPDDPLNIRYTFTIFVTPYQ